MTKKNTWGGRRPGAGRKAAISSKSGAPIVTISTCLPRDVRDVIVAGAGDRSCSQHILALLAKADPAIRDLLTGCE